MLATNARMAGCSGLAKQKFRGDRTRRFSLNRAPRYGLSRHCLMVGLLLSAELVLLPQIAKAEGARTPPAPQPDAQSPTVLPSTQVGRVGRVPGKRRQSGSSTRAIKAKGKGLSYRDQIEDVEFALRGLYGRSQRTLPDAERLLKAPKLLRLRTEIGSGSFQFTGSLGSDLHPKRVGEILEWHAGGRYRTGDWSIGLGYSHALKLEPAARSKGEAEQALRGAVGYSFSERFKASANAVVWEPQAGARPHAAAAVGYLTLSLDF